MREAKEPVARSIDSLLMRPTTPIDGTTGIGDITLGGLYNFYADDKLSLSAGIGLKIPTGQFTDVPSGQRATGGGVTDAGLRFNIDYLYAKWGVIAIQHQFEQMIAKGTQVKDSGIYNNEQYRRSYHCQRHCHR